MTKKLKKMILWLSISSTMTGVAIYLMLDKPKYIIAIFLFMWANNISSNMNRLAGEL